MTLESLADPGIGPIVGACISAIFAINMAFIKWLIKSFSDLRIEIRDVNDRIVAWLDAHEKEDSIRHIENLNRFEKISVALAKLDK